MTRWKITIEYDGRNYSGFQKQDDVPTVQNSIESAIQKFCQQKISITVAGRTDAGVHARGQIAHFDLDYKHSDGTDRPITGYELAKAINAFLLNETISIIDAQEVSDDFHARFGATNKTYSYKIINRPYMPALEKGYVWWRKRDLDIAAMKDAATILVGEHDFTTFRDTECQAKSPIRTIEELSIDTKPVLNGQEIIFTIKGRSFLHHQVRNIVGTLSLVGEGKWTKADVQKALDAKDRAAGGPTAPSDGLYLDLVEY